MKRNLLKLLCSPCCKADLVVFIPVTGGHEQEVDDNDEISQGILSCTCCSKGFPILNGIPRLCNLLLIEEEKELNDLKNKGIFIVNRINRKETVNYDEIEHRIRKIMQSDNNNLSAYLKARVEKNIAFKVRGCEEQEKFINTLKVFYKKGITSFLDIGGGAGGLIKCFSEAYNMDNCIMLEYDLKWAEVAKLRNPGVEILRGDATNLPFKTNSIDVVFSQATLEHIRDYDRALMNMCRVTKNVLFISWNPNKFSFYDFGHLDAPITIFPKSIAKYVALIWHLLRRTGRTYDSISKEIDETHYISTTHVAKKLHKHGEVKNVFTEFMFFSLKSNSSYVMSSLKRLFSKNYFLANLFCKFLVILKIEPQCYYILKKK